MATTKQPKHQFPSGATRSDRRGRGRYDLISPHGLRRLAIRYEEGAALYGDNNWKKGFPISRCIDSAMSHLERIMAGDTSEDHWAAIAWQAFAAMHFEETKALATEQLEDQIHTLEDQADLKEAILALRDAGGIGLDEYKKKLGIE